MSSFTIQFAEDIGQLWRDF